MTNPRATRKKRPMTDKIIQGIAIGRDRTVIPPEDVEKLSALGCNLTEIAQFYGVAESTLKYNFTPELEKGSAQQRIKLRRAMMKNATENMNASVQIFLAKNFLGMSDQPVSGEDNEPLPWIEQEDEDQMEIKDEEIYGESEAE
jgi:hypothetical protein